MYKSTLLLVPTVLIAAGAGTARAQQDIPTTQPTHLTIYIEEVKVGMDAAHAANEAGWPAAFAKAGAPETYLALASMTGDSEVWFTAPYESYTHEGAAMTRNEADPVLSAELARLWANDGQFLESARTIQALARPDLSHGDFPDLAMARFWDISTFRVRSGHDAQFEEAAKLYGEIAAREGADLSFRVYAVTAGAPGGTYLIFSSVNEYGDFDQGMAAGNALFESMSDDEREVFEKYGLEAQQFTVTNRYRLDPGMSYVDEATEAADLAFWGSN